MSKANSEITGLHSRSDEGRSRVNFLLSWHNKPVVDSAVLSLPHGSYLLIYLSYESSLVCDTCLCDFLCLCVCVCVCACHTIFPLSAMLFYSMLGFACISIPCPNDLGIVADLHYLVELPPILSSHVEAVYHLPTWDINSYKAFTNFLILRCRSTIYMN